MLNRKIAKKKIKENEFGLFAIEPIAKGEFIWRENEGEQNNCINLSIRDALMLPEHQKKIFIHFCYQIDDDLLSGQISMEEVLKDDAFFMNHSCDPNAWYEGDSLVARRDIATGEEITYDYGTDFTAFDRGFQCRCASPLCRGTIRKDDWMILCERYGIEHLAPYLRKKIKITR
ncbi:MAG: SET domain-containing protein [Spirochaetes bacterium]|nr:SET domain-containing protein [Spirochaetota bacterium]